MSRSLLKLAIFDCDGTLVDSQGAIVAAMHEACRVFDVLPPDAGAIRRMVGLPLLEVVGRLMPDLGADDVQALRDLYADAFKKLRDDGNLSEPLFPGVHETLERMEGAGWLLAVATGKSAPGLRSTLGRHGLLDRFISLQTADMAQGKPHPEMVFNAMFEAGVGKAAALVIGDTTFDMEMASNAGVSAVGVGWGYHEAEELMGSGAMTVAKSFFDLPDILEGAINK